MHMFQRTIPYLCVLIYILNRQRVWSRQLSGGAVGRWSDEMFDTGDPLLRSSLRAVTVARHAGSVLSAGLRRYEEPRDERGAYAVAARDLPGWCPGVTPPADRA